MLVSPHAAAGIAIGILVSNPIIALPAAIASHFILDTVPHWQETLAPYQPTRKTYLRIPIDIGLAVAMTILALFTQPSHAAIIVSCALAATMPDLDVLMIVFPALKKGVSKRYWDWHCVIQHETSSLAGLIPQLAVIAISLAAIYRG